MPRSQCTLRALLVAMLAVACFFAGVRVERERQRRADEEAIRSLNEIRYSGGPFPHLNGARKKP